WRRRLAPFIAGARASAQSGYRLRLPGFQLDRGSHGRGERGVAVAIRQGRQGGTARTRRLRVGARRHDPPEKPLPEPALGGTATKSGRRACGRQSAANPSGRRAHGEPRLEEWGRDHGSFALAPRGGNDPLHGLSQSRVQQAGSARFAVERRADHSRGPRPVQRSGTLTMALIRGMQFALRTLTRYPGAHAAAILILSLAIGTVVAILSSVDERSRSPMRGI